MNVDEFFVRLMDSNLKDIKKASPYFTADLALLILKVFSGLALVRMDERYSNALAILQDALDRCRTEDIRTPEVLAALDFLEACANPKWPFKQFREALERTASKDWEIEGRWQTLNASLNGIKLAVNKRD